jgi:RsiW-degrading membrane proteinase PrsW (M82 family)
MQPSAYPTPGAPYRPAAAVKPASYSGFLKWAVLGFLVFVVLFAGLAFLTLAGFELGITGLLVSMITSMLPVPIYVALVLWIDRMEAEPVWLLVSGIVWGATVATLFSYIFNTVVGGLFGWITGSAALGSVGGAVISAPFSEELSKGAFIFLLYFFLRKEFDGVIDGIVYASMVGLGFAMAENFLYHGRQLAQHGISGLVGIFGLRNILTPFAHPLFTSLTGIGLGFACTAKNPALRIISPIAGLLAAMGLHSLWNLLASLGFFFLGYILVFVPAFILLLAIVIYSIYREQLIVQKQLTPELESGVLTKEEYMAIGSATRRLTTSFTALTKRGMAGWMAHRRFTQAASELAFQRHRAEHGAVGDPGEAATREAAYLATLSSQRPLFT